MDKIWTPPAIAAKMAAAANCKRVDYVADFAVGNGELLKAAAKRWPKARLIGIDVCRSTIGRLRRSSPNWQLSRCDFTNARSRDRSSALVQRGGKISLVLLNPPFSCRGGTVWRAECGGTELRCSLAMAFLLAALPYLAQNGIAVVLMPAGSMRSDKDRLAWSLIRREFSVDLIAVNGHRTFEGCSPKTVIVRLHRKAKSSPPRQTSRCTKKDVCLQVRLTRGVVQMNTVNSVNGRRTRPLIHTTHLKDGIVCVSDLRVPVDRRSIVGPAVLLQRVGTPDAKKVCLYIKRKPVALSDCVIAMKCVSNADAKRLFRIIESNWSRISSRYGGTCARYVTLDSLQHAFTSMGVAAVIEKRQSRRSLE
jgi:hypothetical protein